MSDEQSEWATVVSGDAPDTAEWLFADVPAEQAAIWLPAMYAVAEALAERMQLPADVLSRLTNAAAAAMAACDAFTPPAEEQRFAVEAAKRALDELTTSQHSDVATTERGGRDLDPD